MWTTIVPARSTAAWATAKFGAVERLDLPRIKQELEENAANAAKSTESRKRLQRGLRHWLGLNRGIIERVDKDLAFWEKMKVELEFHRSICEERKDGPKCLECSSNKVTAILLDWDKIPKDGTPALAEQVHPGCGGLIEVTRSQLRFAFQQKRPTYYNPQGERYASLSRHLFD